MTLERIRVELDLAGEDGNVFWLVVKVIAALTSAGCPDAAQEVLYEWKGGNYNHITDFVKGYVDIIDVKADPRVAQVVLKVRMPEFTNEDSTSLVIVKALAALVEANNIIAAVILLMTHSGKSQGSLIHFLKDY